MHPARRLLERRLLWLFQEPRLAWFGLLLLLVSLAALFVVRSEPLLRVWWVVLQCIGIYTVVDDLRGTGRHFNRPDWRVSMRSWWQRFPRKEDDAGRSATMSANSQLSASLSTSPLAANEGASVEARVQVLEKNMIRLRGDMDAANDAMAAQARSHQAAMAREAAAREAGFVRVNERLETVLAHSLSLAQFGVYCLAAGVLLSGVAPELLCGVNALLPRGP